jgi:hypothetical protein
MSNENMYKEVLKKLLTSQAFYYITVETKYTIHHIERLMGSCKDRGRYKWIAEMKVDCWKSMSKDDEAKRCHIDGGDCFPRLFFTADSMCNELFAWLQMRSLEVTTIESPKI